MLAVLLIGPAIVLAQQPVSRTEEVSAAFTIEAIDHSTRVVTLRNKAGLLEEVYCGPEVQRFDALKVGDTVTFRYYETVVTALSQPGAAAPPSTTVTRTPGAPGGAIARQTTATVTLEAINPKTPSVTVRTASGGRSTFRVQDAKNLEGYKAGDQVTITYTRGLAVSVAPPAAAEPKPQHGDLRIRDARHRLQLQEHQPELVRHDAGHPAAVVRGPVRRGRQHVCRRAADAGLGVRGFDPDGARRAADAPSSSSCSAPASTKGRRRSACAMPTASWARSGRASTWSPFMDIDVFPNSLEYWGPTGWCSSATSRCAGCRSRATQQLTLAARAAGRERRRRPSAPTASSWRTSTAASRCPTSPATTAAGGLGLRRGGRHARPDRSGTTLNDDLRSVGQRHRLGHQPQLQRQVRQSDTLRLQCVFGEGIQNYMNDSPVDVGIVRNPATRAADDGEAIPIVGIVVFLDHNWSSRLVDLGRLFAQRQRQPEAGRRRLQDAASTRSATCSTRRCRT